MDSKQWRTAMGNFATGVTVITTVDHDQKPLGMTANAFTSLSLDPPLLLICVDNKSDTLQGLIDSKKFCVNILPNSQKDVSQAFAKKGLSDKFKDVKYFNGQLEVPVLNECLANIECITTEIIEEGDHWIFIGKGVNIYQPALTPSEMNPLVFYQGKYVSLNSLVGT